MKKILFALLLVGSLGSFLTGCVNTIDGNTRWGVPAVRDKIESRYERPVETIYEASKVVLIRLGKLNVADEIGKVLEAKVDAKTVYVRVTPDVAEPTISVVTVQVRGKSGGGDLDLASEVDKQIALQLSAKR